MKKTIVFDFDGTLANSLQIAIEVYNSVAPYFNTRRIRNEEINHFRNSSPKEIFKELNIQNWKLPLLLFFVKYQFHKKVNKVEFIDGMKEVVIELKNSGYQLGILTNNSKNTIQKFLMREGIENYFNFIYTAKSFYGKDKKLEKLIKDYNLEKESVIYIGDEVKDIEACKKVGISIVSVSWGTSSSAMLKTYYPTYLVNNPEEILTIFADM